MAVSVTRESSLAEVEPVGNLDPPRGGALGLGCQGPQKHLGRFLEHLLVSILGGWGTGTSSLT